MSETNKNNLIAAAFAAALLALPLAGCNTPTAAVDTAGAPQDQTGEQAPEAQAKTAEAAKEPEPNIVRKPPTVTQKGTNIRAIVNGQAITNYDIERRAAFLNLRRVGGDRRAKALDELVDEAVKMGEAKRLNTVAPDSMVDESFTDFAKSNRMSTSQLTQILNQSGVTAGHFKEFIRGQISWQRAVGMRFQAETREKVQKETLFELRKSGAEKPQTTEFLLQQVIFVIPADKMKAMLPQRRKEAAAFRQMFTNCDDTLERAVGLRDVTVRNLPRILEPQLPPEWSKEVSQTAQGQTTDIKNTEKGVEFLAVCKRTTVSSDNVAEIMSAEKEFESFNERGSDISEAYLKELKAAAQIIYR